VEYLKVREAARRLNVSPSTLRAWEQRFGFPRPGRSPGGHRLYRHGDIVALRDALEQGLSISSAISRVRQGHTIDAEALVGPLCAIDSERAATVVEGALALRSLERTVVEVLLPALAHVHRRHGPDSVAWAFAASWVDEWIRWARRLALHLSHPLNVLVGDSTRGELTLDASHALALQLFCARAGAHVLTLPVSAMKGVAGAVARFAPDVILVTPRRGHQASTERWIAVAQPAAGGVPVGLYRRDGGVATTIQGVHRLDASPLTAQQELLRIARAPSPTARAS
jgi:DNA-binding transcriptional MerR regulator